MRQRVFFKLLAAMFLVLLVAAGMLDISQQNILKASLQNRLARALQDKAQSLVARVAETNPKSLPAIAREEARTAGASVSIIDRSGKVLADSDSSSGTAQNPTETALLTSPEIRAILVQHRKFGQHVANGTLYVTAPAGEDIVRLGASLRDIRGALHTVRDSLLWATLLALFLATLVSALLAHAVARRLARIVDFAHRLSSGDFSARVKESGGDEIAEMSNALDQTAARVEAVFRELEASRKEMEAVLDSMEEAVIAVDPQGRIHWTNRVMVRLIGSPIHPGTALVQTVRDPDFLACVEQSLHSAVPATGRARAVVPGRIFEVSAAPMLGGSAVAVLHDVTEIERMEKTRRDFIANISHELRTPLTSIAGYAETMLENSNELPAHAREFLAIISRNAARMTRLTEDLLALARIESGEYKLKLRPVPASQLMEEATAIANGLVIDRNFVLEKVEVAQADVMADPDAIVQVLSNLLENAVKYGEGKRIVIGSRLVSSQVEFYVRDFGSGIASEHLGRIFERFYRVDKGRSQESGGTGLGLSIAKHIILAHGGTIRAESDLNHGSTFFFTLSVTHVDAAEEDSQAELEKTTGS